MKKKLKIALSFLILLATIVAFTHYATTHPELLNELKHTPPLSIVLLTVLYAIWFVALVLVLRVSLRLFGKVMSRQENLLLNAYSTLINFFGPGQSGPAFRAIYLKKQHNLRIKDYTFATLLYYGFYAILSAGLVLVGTRPWWQTLLAVLLVAGFSALVVRAYSKKSKVKAGEGFTPKIFLWLFLATALQTVAQVVIFTIELQSINPQISIAQAITYTGIANFALFVSLTPGAIGIRESFLLFSQQLHGIDSQTIIAANVIDRSVYLVFLGLLFVLALSLHAKDRLGLKGKGTDLEPPEK